MRSLRTVSELTEELRVLPTGMRIIAIDGRCAAGKTTLAARLAKELGGDVIHMDDFFLPPALRTQERRSEPGGNVHYERFLTEVIPKLASGQAFSYQRFDCSRMAPGDWLLYKITVLYSWKALTAAIRYWENTWTGKYFWI